MKCMHNCLTLFGGLKRTRIQRQNFASIIMGDLEEVHSQVFPRRWVAAPDTGERTLGTGAAESTESSSVVQDGTKAGSCAIIDGGTCEVFKCRSFRLATYNILTDNCIREGQYLHCPQQIRYMPARHGHIMKEILSMSPDVLCIQEADKQHYERVLQPDMDAQGYSGVNTVTEDGQGLAVFWRRTVFDLVKHRSKLCHKLADPIIESSGTLKQEEKLQIRAAIIRPERVLAVRLRHLATQLDVVVSNVHIGWTELRSPALQALQISMGLRLLSDLSRDSATPGGCNEEQVPDRNVCLNGTNLNEAGRLSLNGADPNKMSEDRPDDGPLSVTSSDRCVARIICGDFNTPPHYPGYGMLSGKDVTRSSAQLMKDIGLDTYAYLNEIERVKAFKLFDLLPEVYQHGDSNLQSAYLTTLGHEPEVTNCDDASEQAGVVRPLCLDYIWFSQHSLAVTSVLETPSKESMVRLHCLPNLLFPSDHIPLSAEFRFK